MTNMQQANRTLEVACGPGRHSLLLANAFLKPNAVLVSCDISNEMLVKVKQTFDTADWTKVAGNKCVVDLETDYREFKAGSNSELANLCDIDAIQAAQGEFNRFVFGCRANNELLPFADGSFNAYIANLSLMLVNNHVNQINQAFRVLSPGGIACFTIWGDPQKNLQFTIGFEAMKRNIPEDMYNKFFFGQYRNFRLYEDKGAALRNELEAAGFTDIKIWE